MCGDNARATTLMAKMPSSTSAALAARKNGSSRNSAGGQLNPALKQSTKPLSWVNKITEKDCQTSTPWASPRDAEHPSGSIICHKLLYYFSTLWNKALFLPKLNLFSCQMNFCTYSYHRLRDMCHHHLRKQLSCADIGMWYYGILFNESKMYLGSSESASTIRMCNFLFLLLLSWSKPWTALDVL